MFLGDILVQENSVNTAQRQVNTILYYDTAPYSNMVLGEVIK